MTCSGSRRPPPCWTRSRRMVETNVGSLLVTEAGKVIGIVTERDYLRRVTLEGRNDATPVREIISLP